MVWNPAARRHRPALVCLRARRHWAAVHRSTTSRTTAGRSILPPTLDDRYHSSGCHTVPQHICREIMEAGYSMNRPFVPNPTPGRGSKACMNCAKVKCKCIYRNDGLTCERCYRLKKICTPSALVRRHKRGQAAARAARLEGKLDDLVSFLRAESGRGGRASDQGRDAEDDDDDDESRDEDEDEDKDTSPQVAFLTPALTIEQARSVPSATATALSGNGHVFAAEEPQTSEAEESLNKFREETILFFPFHYIPPYVTARQLQDAYPFLWLNIMSVTARSNKKRLALGDQARSIIFQKIVIEREKSMDLLLGLIMSLGWSHLQRRDKFYQSLFSQLALLMVHDLGLHQQHTESSSKAFCGPGALQNQPQASNGGHVRNNDERRVALSTFLVTSMVSYTLKGPDGLRWSTALDDYATYLISNSELDQDKILVALVRMQLIINQVPHAPCLSTNNDTAEIFVSALRARLQSVMRSEHISPAVLNHPAVLEHYYFTELLILESSINQSQHWPGDPDLRRFEIYQAQLNAVRAWLSTFHTTDFRFYGDMAFFSYSELVRVMVSLYKLTTLEDPAWYRPAMRKTLDLLPALDRLIATFEQLKAATALWSSDVGEDGESFTWAITVFQSMKAAWKEEVGGLEEMDSHYAGVPQGNLLTMPAYGSSDIWLADMFSM